jgi:isoleucyl-tRNA synthetase
MITKGSPWASRRVGHAALDDVLRQFLLTLWNVYGFFVTYANADGFDPSTAPPPVADRPEMDRWAISQLHRTIRAARGGLAGYDATAAGRRIEAFVDDLSNWYVRRSRRRFWDPGGQEGHDAAAAFHTLHECLVTTATLLAPFTPFVTEEVWRNLAAERGGRPVSVHLADYPEEDVSLIDDDLDEAMEAARQIVELGRRVRVETRSRTRLPLAEAVVHVPGSHRLVGPLLATVADELNVKRIEFAESDEAFGRWRAKPNFKTLGPRLGETVKEVATALAADDGHAARALARGEPVTVAGVSIGPDDVDLVQEVATGWGVASEGGLTVALDLEVTEELRREGLARDLIRVVQDARKAAGLHVSDRIVLAVEAEGEPAEALARHRGLVAGETLAVDVVLGAGAGSAFRQQADLDGSVVTVWLARA